MSGPLTYSKVRMIRPRQAIVSPDMARRYEPRTGSRFSTTRPRRSTRFSFFFSGKIFEKHVTMASQVVFFKFSNFFDFRAVSRRYLFFCSCSSSETSDDDSSERRLNLLASKCCHRNGGRQDDDDDDSNKGKYTYMFLIQASTRYIQPISLCRQIFQKMTAFCW